jgi:hypothetical protein
VADYAEPLLRYLNAIYKQQNQSLDEQPVIPAERKFFI